MWMYRLKDKKFVLFIIWSGVDRFGPFQFAKLLFRAYHTSALPREINPFLIEIRSPKEVMGEMVLKLDQKKDYEFQIVEVQDDGAQQPAYEWRSEWVYHAQAKRRSAVEVVRDFDRFKRNIDIAA